VNRTLRILAAAGVVWVVLKRLPYTPAAAPGQRVIWGFALLTLALLAAVSWALFREETRQLLRHTDLLVPLGLLVSANELLRTLTNFPVNVSLVTVDFETGYVGWAPTHYGELLREAYLLAAGVIYAGWVMTLVIELTGGGTVSLARAFKESLRRFWKVLAVLALGWSVAFALTQFIRMSTEGFLPFALLLGVSCLCWNVVTAPLLPFVLAEGRRPFPHAVRDGLRAGWVHWRLWLVPVALQYALLGGVSFFPIGLDSQYAVGNILRGVELNVQWDASGIWTGAFANSFGWYSTALKTLVSGGDLLTYVLLSALFSAFAIIIKLRVTRLLRGVPSFGAQLGRSADPAGEPAAYVNLPPDKLGVRT
jgi:hypothetical protein